jgi:hypothetical protein
VELDYERYMDVGRWAARYAEIEIGNAGAKNRPERLVIVAEAAKFNPLEMAYFCQQMVSHLGDVHKASMALTVFTNLMKEAMGA